MTFGNGLGNIKKVGARAPLPGPNALVDWALEQLRAQAHLPDLARSNPLYARAVSRLKVACEQAKIDLSRADRATIQVSDFRVEDSSAPGAQSRSLETHFELGSGASADANALLPQGSSRPASRHRQRTSSAKGAFSRRAPLHAPHPPSGRRRRRPPGSNEHGRPPGSILAERVQPGERGAFSRPRAGGGSEERPARFPAPAQHRAAGARSDCFDQRGPHQPAGGRRPGGRAGPTAAQPTLPSHRPIHRGLSPYRGG
jgi:hypothetical protein